MCRNQCKSCPLPHVEVPNEMAPVQVTYFQWGTKKVEGKTQYNLWRVTESISEMVKKLEKLTLKMKTHLFSAAHLWTLYHEQCEALCAVTDILTVEDYQMNLPVQLSQMTTSMIYGTNTKQISMYPLVVKFRRSPDGQVETAAIIFLSEGGFHD
jgi:hypothetical protein